MPVESNTHQFLDLGVEHRAVYVANHQRERRNIISFHGVDLTCVVE